MFFTVYIGGIEIQLRIKGYKASDQDNWCDNWCNCDFVFRSGGWLDYHKEDDELLLSCEVDELETELSKLLNGELKDVKEIGFIEPDFVFTLYPEKDLRNDPKYAYIKPGHEIADIYMEWKVYFWHGGLTDNFLTVTFGRNNIIRLRDYLLFIKTKR